MLEVRNLTVHYGRHPALQDVNLSLNPGEIVVILGANGAGKSTLLRAISGICAGDATGQITHAGQPVLGLTPDEIVEKGIALVPEGRGIFADLSVRENLLLGAYAKRARHAEATSLERVFALFPKLRERETQIARTMSGGEQQMVAIGRAMMSAPQILMLDEPSLGLAPLLCKELFQNLRSVRDLGIGVLLVEQNAKQSLAIADRGYLLENTRITHEDKAARLASDPAVQKAYLGAGSKVASRAAAPTSDVPVGAPAAPSVPSRPEPRRTADQQIGFSIDDLVEDAARVSAEPRARVVPAAPDPAHASKLSTVLKDIERAAMDARKRPAHVGHKTQSPSGPVPAQSSGQAVPDASPPVIEIYRRPRVEVYRRRASGGFERD